MNTKEESGRRIRQLREGLDLTLQEVSARTNGAVSPSRLSNFEHGLRMVSVDAAKALAPVLRTKPEYLLTLTELEPDPSEIALIDLYRACDDRGKIHTLHTVEKEASFVAPKRLGDERRQRENKVTQERRKIPFTYRGEK